VAPGLGVEIAESPRDAVTRAWAQAPVAVVAGSIFLLADIMSEFGGS
jgi:hypothetical protein